MVALCRAHGHSDVMHVEVQSQSVCHGSRVGGARASLEAEPKGQDQKLDQGLGLRVEPKWMPKAELEWLYDVVIQTWMA